MPNAPAPMSNPGSKAPGAGGSNGGGNQPVNNQMAPAPPTNPAVTPDTLVTVNYPNGQTGVMTLAQVSALGAEGGLAANGIVNYTIGSNAPLGTVTAPNITPQTPGTTPSPTEMPVANVEAAINANAPANAPIITLPEATSITAVRTAAIKAMDNGTITKVNISPDSKVITTVGQVPSDITTTAIGMDGTITAQSPSGTKVTTPDGKTTFNSIAVPTVTPVAATDAHFVFNDANNGNKEIDVSEVQYNSWTPFQQFAFQMSIGAIKPGSTINVNADGTWGSLTQGDAGTVAVGKDTGVLARYTNPDGTINIRAALAGGVTADYIVQHTQASISDIQMAQALNAVNSVLTPNADGMYDTGAINAAVASGKLTQTQVDAVFGSSPTMTVTTTTTSSYPATYSQDDWDADIASGKIQKGSTFGSYDPKTGIVSYTTMSNPFPTPTPEQMAARNAALSAFEHATLAPPVAQITSVKTDKTGINLSIVNPAGKTLATNIWNDIVSFGKSHSGITVPVGTKPETLSQEGNALKTAALKIASQAETLIKTVKNSNATGAVRIAATNVVTAVENFGAAHSGINVPAGTKSETLAEEGKAVEAAALSVSNAVESEFKTMKTSNAVSNLKNASEDLVAAAKSFNATHSGQFKTETVDGKLVVTRVAPAAGLAIIGGSIGEQLVAEGELEVGSGGSMTPVVIGAILATIGIAIAPTVKAAIEQEIAHYKTAHQGQSPTASDISIVDSTGNSATIQELANAVAATSTQTSSSMMATQSGAAKSVTTIGRQTTVPESVSPTLTQGNVQPLQESIPVSSGIKPVQESIPVSSGIKPIEESFPVDSGIKQTQESFPTDSRIKPIQETFPLGVSSEGMLANPPANTQNTRSQELESNRPIDDDEKAKKKKVADAETALQTAIGTGADATEAVDEYIKARVSYESTRAVNQVAYSNTLQGKTTVAGRANANPVTASGQRSLSALNQVINQESRESAINKAIEDKRNWTQAGIPVSRQFIAQLRNDALNRAITEEQRISAISRAIEDKRNWTQEGIPVSRQFIANMRNDALNRAIAEEQRINAIAKEIEDKRNWTQEGIPVSRQFITNLRNDALNRAIDEEAKINALERSLEDKRNWTQNGVPLSRQFITQLRNDALNQAIDEEQRVNALQRDIEDKRNWTDTGVPLSRQFITDLRNDALNRAIDEERAKKGILGQPEESVSVSATQAVQPDATPKHRQAGTTALDSASATVQPTTLISKPQTTTKDTVENTATDLGMVKAYNPSAITGKSIDELDKNVSNAYINGEISQEILDSYITARATLVEYSGATSASSTSPMPISDDISSSLYIVGLVAGTLAALDAQKQNATQQQIGDVVQQAIYISTGIQSQPKVDQITKTASQIAAQQAVKAGLSVASQQAIQSATKTEQDLARQQELERELAQQQELETELETALENATTNETTTEIEQEIENVKEEELELEQELAGVLPPGSSIPPPKQEILSLIKPLTLTWKQGKVRWILPPKEDGTYDNEDKFAVSYKTQIPGVTKYAEGEGSAQATLELIGGKSKVPFKDTDVDIGWAMVHIAKVGDDFTMNVVPSDEANWEGVNKYTKEKDEAEELAEYREWRAQYTGKPPQGMPKDTPIVAVVKPFKDSPPEMHKAEWTQYSNYQGSPIKVFKVDGKWVRENLDPDFTAGGHNEVYAYIPKNQVWIERMRNPEEDEANLGHELDELYDMKHSDENYAVAHQQAVEREFGVVRKSKNINKEVESSLSKFVPESDEQEKPENIPELKMPKTVTKSHKKTIIDDNKRYYLGHETRQPELVANI